MSIFANEQNTVFFFSNLQTNRNAESHSNLQPQTNTKAHARTRVYKHAHIKHTHFTTQIFYNPSFICQATHLCIVEVQVFEERLLLFSLESLKLTVDCGGDCLSCWNVHIFLPLLEPNLTLAQRQQLAVDNRLVQGLVEATET